jgi:FAD/FMN-containing dehydrogenase
VAAADDIPLSTATGRDSAYLAVHVYRGQPHETYFGAVESVMAGLGGRPHWGKLHTRTAEHLRASYPAFDEVVALRDKLDPDRRFGNAYLERVFG